MEMGYFHNVLQTINILKSEDCIAVFNMDIIFKGVVTDLQFDLMGLLLDLTNVLIQYVKKLHFLTKLHSTRNTSNIYKNFMRLGTCFSYLQPLLTI